jgi:class 3 adenylate cyclase
MRPVRRVGAYTVDVVADTRFAPSSTGPVAYRTDGEATGRWLVVVPDRADPFGPAGEAAFDAFAGALAARGWQLLTLLDGRGPGTATAEVAGTDRRMGAVAAAVADAGVEAATVLGVGNGAVPAALAVAMDPAWASRLVLYGSFTGESAVSDWAAPDDRPLPVPDGAWPAVQAKGGEASRSRLPVDRMKPEERAELAADLEEAKHSLQMAREWWQRFRTTRRGSGPDGASAGGGPAFLSELAELIPSSGPFAGIRDLVRRPDRWEGGLDELIRQVTQLEGSGTRRGEDMLASVAVPTIVADTSGDPASAGLAIASRIRGARHRALAEEPDLPWTKGAPSASLLAILDEAGPAPRPTGLAAPPASPSTRLLATLLFTDIVASTERLAEVGDTAWRQLLERHHAVVRENLARYGGTEIDNAGDGFLASFATPAPGIRCALAAIGELAAIGLAIRCGLHTGECEQIAGKLGGIAVHIGARIAGKAGPGEVLVSATVRDLVAGSGITFADHGTAELKGLPGTWPLYAVTGAEGGNP